MFEFILFLSFPAAMVFAGAMDLFTMTIPNRISIGLVVAFLVAAVALPLGWHDLANHAGAGLLMLCVGIGLFAAGVLGGGDAKLMAAASLWLGFENLLPFLVLTAVAGGVLVAGILAYRRWMPPAWLLGQAWAMRLHAKTGGVPYGIALAAAGLWLYPSTLWFHSFAM